MQQKLSRLFSVFGYQQVQLPILGPAELFLRKSGGELASQMYSFPDASGRQVCLRPEFTAPIMRLFLDSASDGPAPVRWQYSGPVFRSGERDASSTTGGGQFTQIGAELIGAATVQADAELLGMVLRVPEELGISDWSLRIGDLAVIHSLLDVIKISERSRGFIISQIPNLSQGEAGIEQALARARQLHLIGAAQESDNLALAVAGLDDQQARNVLQGLLGWSSAGPTADTRTSAVPGVSNQVAANTPELGRREPSEVIDRLLRKIRGSDEPEQLRRGLELVSQLVSIKGKAEDALSQAEEQIRGAGAATSALDRLRTLFEILPRKTGHGSTIDRLDVDFGLARGIAYYNGIIFEVNSTGASQPLGGGGRYDDLARALGSPTQVPALGFAFSLEALLDTLGDPLAAESARGAAPTSLVAAAKQSSFPVVLAQVEELTDRGERAEAHLQNTTLEQAVAEAKRRGIGQVVWVDEKELVTLHNLG